MAEENPNSLKQGATNELNIEAMISAPLVAASKANVHMLTGQTNFLLNYCFDRKGKNSTHRPVMIRMMLSRATIDETKSPGSPNRIKYTNLEFKMPLLCLIPLNSLAINKVTVDFALEITSATSWKNTSQKKVLSESVQLNGRISGDEKSAQEGKRKSVSTMKVHIDANPLPLPQGVLTLIDMYTKSIQPVSRSIKAKEDDEYETE